MNTHLITKPMVVFGPYLYDPTSPNYFQVLLHDVLQFALDLYLDTLFDATTKALAEDYPLLRENEVGYAYDPTSIDVSIGMFKAGYDHLNAYEQAFSFMRNDQPDAPWSNPQLLTVCRLFYQAGQHYIGKYLVANQHYFEEALRADSHAPNYAFHVGLWKAGLVRAEDQMTIKTLDDWCGYGGSDQKNCRTFDSD